MTILLLDFHQTISENEVFLKIHTSTVEKFASLMSLTSYSFHLK